MLIGSGKSAQTRGPWLTAPGQDRSAVADTRAEPQGSTPSAATPSAASLASSLHMSMSTLKNT